MKNVQDDVVANEKLPHSTWSPSSSDMIDAALRLAHFVAGDRVLDLGCGDGRVLSTAIRRGALAIGLESDVELAQSAREHLASTDRAEVVVCDVYETDLARYEPDIVIAFLTRASLQRLVPGLTALRAGTRLVTIDMPVPGWMHDGEDHNCYLYRLPTRLAPRIGAYRWPHSGYSLRLPVDQPAHFSLVVSHPAGAVSIRQESWPPDLLDVRTGVSDMPNAGLLAIDFTFRGQTDAVTTVTHVHEPALGGLLLYATFDRECAQADYMALDREQCQRVIAKVLASESGR